MANSREVADFKMENEYLKQLVAKIALKNRVLKKSLNGTDFEGIDLWDIARQKNGDHSNR